VWGVSSRRESPTPLRESGDAGQLPQRAFGRKDNSELFIGESGPAVEGTRVLAGFRLGGSCHRTADVLHRLSGENAKSDVGDVLMIGARAIEADLSKGIFEPCDVLRGSLGDPAGDRLGIPRFVSVADQQATGGRLSHLLAEGFFEWCAHRSGCFGFSDYTVEIVVPPVAGVPEMPVASAALDPVEAADNPVSQIPPADRAGHGVEFSVDHPLRDAVDHGVVRARGERVPTEEDVESAGASELLR